MKKAQREPLLHLQPALLLEPVEIMHEEEEEISSALQQLGDGGLLKRFKALIMSGSQTQGERP